MRHLKHLAGMLLSSRLATFFRYHSFSPASRCMIAPFPQLRQYPEMGGPLARTSEEGDMATRFGDLKSVWEVLTPVACEKKLLPRPKTPLKLGAIKVG